MELKYIGFFILIIALLIYFMYNRSFTESFSNINVNYNRLFHYVPNNKKTEADGKYFLFATNKSMMSGVNPLIFGTYTDYITWYNMNTSQAVSDNILKPIPTNKNEAELIEEFKKEGFNNKEPGWRNRAYDGSGSVSKREFDKMNPMSDKFRGGDYAENHFKKYQKDSEKHSKLEFEKEFEPKKYTKHHKNNNYSKRNNIINIDTKRKLRKKIDNNEDIDLENINELAYISSLVESESDAGYIENYEQKKKNTHKKSHPFIDEVNTNDYADNDDDNVVQEEVVVSDNNIPIQETVPIEDVDEDNYEYPVAPTIKNERKIFKSNGVTKSSKFDYKHKEPNPQILNNWGWSYMPPEVWSVPQQRPPPCIPQKNCPVCPTMDSRYADALKWDSVGSIMPKFEYKEIYNPDYYLPGWFARDRVRYVPENYGDVAPIIEGKGKFVT